jgi:hypothetical protein
MFKVTEGALLPASDESRAVLAKLKEGEQVACELYRERSPRFANAVNAIFTRLGEARGIRTRNVRGWMCLRTGRLDVVRELGKPALLVPHGTGPRDMSALEFEVFWEAARDYICEHVLGTLALEDAKDLADMIERLR